MPWRIHFTAEDLARTRLATSLGPLAETLFALSILRCHTQRPAVLSAWRQRARARLTLQMAPLTMLAPRGTWGVDLWTLTGAAPTMESGVAGLRAIPGDRLAAELDFFDRRGAGGRLPAAAWDVVDPCGDGREKLVAAAHAAFAALVAPYWTKIDAHLQSERISRGKVLLDGGIEGLLGTLHPSRMRWRMPTLEVLLPGEADIYLAGRGITLVPSLFVGDFPILLEDLGDPTAAPKLIFPATRDVPGGPVLDDSQCVEQALTALIGRTRAAALRRIADGCTTSELARHVGVSAAAASQHATILRNAGLISTRRHGGAVWHSLTPLGITLLGSGP